MWQIFFFISVLVIVVSGIKLMPRVVAGKAIESYLKKRKQSTSLDGQA